MSPCVDDALGGLKTCAQYPNHGSTLVHAEINLSLRVMLVGEAPGEEEVNKGKPFVGRAGEFLDEMLVDVGLARTDLYITNIVKHRPLKRSSSGTDKDRKPCAREIRGYVPWLSAELQTVNPILVIPLGNVAMRWFLRSQRKITEVRGWAFTWDGTCVFPTFHPSFVRRQGQIRRRGSSGARTLRALRKNSAPFVEIPSDATSASARLGYSMLEEKVT